MLDKQKNNASYLVQGNRNVLQWVQESKLPNLMDLSLFDKNEFFKFRFF